MVDAPQSNKEKQEAFRARNAMLGLTEVRGIYLPPPQHAELKKLAQKLKANYRCIKCGYKGPLQVGHQRPSGGECGYIASEDKK